MVPNVILACMSKVDHLERKMSNEREGQILMAGIAECIKWCEAASEVREDSCNFGHRPPVPTSNK